jgi:hypothetical protein
MAKEDRVLDNLTTQEEKELKPKPVGSNSLGSYAIYQQRSYYKNQVYPTQIIPTPVDFWYDKNKSFYGRVDTRGNAIIPDSSFMSKIKESSTENVWAMDFVVDAFNAFRHEYTFLNKLKSEGTPFQYLTPYSAYRSPAGLYRDYLDLLFQDFLSRYMSDPKRQKTVANFDSFLKMFLKYAKSIESQFPITFSSYMLSRQIPSNASGLVIDVSADEYDRDLLKYENFISNDNFDCYVKTAEKYGFKVDKNFPGRMIADVASNAMKEYMKPYPRIKDVVDDAPPVEPTYSPPARPDSNLTTPWKVGDLIEIVVIIPNNNRSGNDPWFILTDFTMPKNRRFPIGKKAKFYTDPNTNIEFDQYEYLINYFQGYGFPVYYTIEITEINPPNTLVTSGGSRIDPTRGRLPGGPTQELDLLDTVNNSESPNQARVANILDALDDGFRTREENFQFARVAEDPDLLNTLQGTVKGFKSPVTVPKGFAVTALSNAFPYFESQPFYAFSIEDLNRFSRGDLVNFKKYGWRRGDSRGTTISISSVFNMQFPEKAAHISPLSVNDNTYVRRFQSFYNFRDALVKYQSDLDYYNSTRWPAIVERYERELSTWEEQTRRNDVLRRNQNFPQLTFDNLIQQRYNLAQDYDIELLKEFCTNLYYSFYSQKPQIVMNETYKCGNNTFKTRKKIIPRERISKAIIREKYNDEFWIEYYTNIKNLEKEKRMDKKDLHKIIYQAKSAARLSGVSSAIQYINQELKKHS